MMKLIDGGHLSDTPGVCLYTIVGRDGDGLPLYSTNRGTNDVEGIHQKLLALCGSWTCGPELIDAILCDYRHAHNVSMGIK